MKKILTLAVLSSLSTGVFAQDPRNSDIKVTAKIDAGCFLTANNINFGVLPMPLSDSKAESNIYIKCSKNAPLTIDIDFTNGANSNLNQSNIQFEIKSSYNAEFTENGIDIGGLVCYNSNTIFIRGERLAAVLGLPINRSSKGTKGICSGDKVVESTLRTIIPGGVTHGILQGMTSGEQMKYSLEVPNSSSKIWAKNMNSYSITGSGSEQTIPMKANIKRADNSTHRLTPDTYQSTLTVILNY